MLFYVHTHKHTHTRNDIFGKYWMFLCTYTHTLTHAVFGAVFEDNRRRGLQENGTAQHESPTVVQHAPSRIPSKLNTLWLVWTWSSPLECVVVTVSPGAFTQRWGSRNPRQLSFSPRLHIQHDIKVMWRFTKTSKARPSLLCSQKCRPVLYLLTTQSANVLSANMHINLLCREKDVWEKKDLWYH